MENLTAANRSNVRFCKSEHGDGSAFCGDELYFKCGVVTVTMHDGSDVARFEIVVRNVVQQNDGF
jgi:hypothetical protein